MGRPMMDGEWLPTGWMMVKVALGKTCGALNGQWLLKLVDGWLIWWLIDG